MNASDLLVREPTLPISAPPPDGDEIPTGVRIYTDGSILVNPGGAGGWAIVVTRGSEILEIKSGAVPVSTNNRMELTAVYEAMSWATTPVEIISDSEYVVKGLNVYMPAWRARNWRKVKNLDLWEKIDIVYMEQLMTLSWIKGHNGHRFNELADKMAGEAARLIRDA